MKKILFLAALATLTFASCMNDEFVGVDNSPANATEGTDAILFGGGFKAVTRAGNHVGADAASLLKETFIVSGFKGSATQATTGVFNDYLVKWKANSAGKTASNTDDWEYVGKTSPINTSGEQTIKYWDYSQALYDFIAYSPSDNTVTAKTT